MIAAAQVTPALAHHGEGPVWHDGWGGLRWVDMLAGDVLTLDAAGTVQRSHVGTVVAALRPRTDGSAVVALERGFAWANTDLTDITPLGEIWSDPTVRMNDGGCDPDGRLWCGTMAYDAAPGRGALYRLDTDGTVTRELTSVTISNGLCWSPDGTRAYYVDTPTQRIDVFDYDRDTGLHHRRPLVEIPADTGAPDGLTVDAEGGVWVALWGGSAVHRYAPDGALTEVVSVPVRQVSACAFGGPQLDELYVTTSRQGLGAQAESAAGALFRAGVPVRGLPVRTFGPS